MRGVATEEETTDAVHPHQIELDDDDRVGPQRIGRYVVLEPIGMGGMGRVYRAADPALGRVVAIKALRRRDARLTARLRREAQALAQLHSPNVIDVFDVLVSEGNLYIAMELVQGPTLTAWARNGASWREKLAVLLQAGAGVVAAHRAGLLHRDLKPSNILVGDDGRARVMDFGLALGTTSSSRGGGTPSGDVDEPPLEERLTDHEHVIGTLPYMAPEQHAGRADERSDQFAFCVTAFEVLHGTRPFAGGTRRQQLAAKQAGDMWKPGPTDVPAAVHRALCRGLAARAEDRWASMDDLLSELRRAATPSRRGPWLAGIAGAIAVGALGWAAFSPTHACDDRLGAVWDDARRERVRVAFLDTGSLHAEPTGARVARGLDAYAGAWTAARRDACTRASDDPLLDARTRCLAQRRDQLRTLVDTLLEADATVVDHAVAAVADLPAVEDCADDAELARADATSDRTQAHLVDVLRADLARAKTLGDAGKPEEGLRLAAMVRAEAERLGDARSTAEAHLRVARLEAAMERWDDAVESYRSAYFAARRVDASDLAADAATAVAESLGRELGRHDEAATWIEHARVEVERLGDPKAAIELDLTEGMLHAERGAYDEALEHYHRARASAKTLEEPADLVGATLNGIGAVQYRVGRYDDALASLEEALEDAKARLGPEHPQLATMLTNLGSVHEARGDLETAIDTYRRALSIKEAAVGSTHPSLAPTLINLGTALYALGRDADALAQYTRALGLWSSPDAAPAAELGPLLNNLGLVSNATDEHAAALAYHERALVVYEAAYGPDHPEVAVTLMLVGAQLGDMGEHAPALERLELARARAEQTLGAEHPRTTEVLHEIGRVLVAAGRAEEAVDILERALAQRLALGVSPDSTRFQLARALWDSERDRSRALELARDAREGLHARLPGTASLLERVDAWIAERVNDPALVR